MSSMVRHSMAGEVMTVLTFRVLGHRGRSDQINGSGAGEAGASNGGDLIFAHKLGNFELEFEWKVGKGSNSGVFS